MKRMFISYSHEDEDIEIRLRTHLEGLKKQGKLASWDDRLIHAGQVWDDEIETALNNADGAVLLISPGFLASDFIMGKEVPFLLRRMQEQKVCLFPLIIKGCNWREVEWLNKLQVRPEGGKALEDIEKPGLDTLLANFTREILDILYQRKPAEPASPCGGAAPAQPKISISKMPTTGEKLFGREKELALLDEAWADPGIRVFSLVAWGGVGKTALVNKWLNLLSDPSSPSSSHETPDETNNETPNEKPNETLLEVREPFLEKVPGRRRHLQPYGGAARVYAWSFYSQGAAEGKQASADEFLQSALAWFGDAEPGAGSNVEKGRRLAELIRSEKTLLILDGIEPLQYPPGELRGFDGLLKDQGLSTLLKELAAAQPGLCVITTREPLTDLSDKKGHGYRELALEHLSNEAGARLLESLGVKGRAADLAAAVNEYGGHALALTLLGHYLATVYRGDIRKRDKIPAFALTMDKKKGRHARRVMEAYEGWLGESPELNILRIMGLFDRPVEKGAVDALMTPGQEPIPGITERLAGLTEAEWGFALENLRAAGLLAKADPHKPEVLDCHPLVREHFGAKLLKENPGGRQQAHQRLYEYYKALPGKKLPDTLAEMEPLFAAVAHGCAAGLYQKTLDEVYYSRIQRDGRTNYCCNKLGAFGSDLAAVSHFFQDPWAVPASGLTESDKALVLSWAGFRLRAMGRLVEAQEPMKAGLAMRIKQENWIEAAKDAGNLSALLLTLGQVAEAVDYARLSVDYADKSGDGFLKEAMRTALADSLHQQGKLEEAAQWFGEAEALQAQRQPQHKYLYSLQGFRFCDLLLAQGKYQEVRERAEKFFEWRLPSDSLLTISLDNLIAGRACLQQALSEKTRDFRQAEDYLDQAVEGLRASGNQDDLPRGLLARAECFRHQGKLKQAEADLAEAEEIIRLGSMNLYLDALQKEKEELRMLM